MIGQYNLTLPPFHYNPLTFAVVCLSIHRHRIAKPLQCYLSLTVQLSTHFTWQFDCERSAVSLPTLWQDYECAAVKKLCSMAASVFNFWKPLQPSKAGLQTWRRNYEWWQWYWHNLQICQFFLLMTRRSSTFIQCEKGIKESAPLGSTQTFSLDSNRVSLKLSVALFCWEPLVTMIIMEVMLMCCC